MAGNATIGALKVALGLDSAQFEAGLKKAQAGLSGFGKVAAVAGGAAAAALVAAGAAMAVAIKGAIDNADELSKTAQKVGVTVEALSRLKYAAELSDVSLEGLATGLKKLSVNMSEAAATGKGKAAGAFQALGISVTDASGALKSSDVVLTEIAGKFGALQDGAGKTALAVALFGKSGADLIPLLNSGADGLAEMAAEADALGLTIDTKTAKASEAFNDNLTRLKAVGAGLTNQMAAALAPALVDITNGFVTASKDAFTMKTIGDALSGSLKFLASAAIVVAAGFGAVVKSLGGLARAFDAVLRGDFAGAVRIMNEKAFDMQSVANSVKAIWSNTGAQIEQAAPKAAEGIAAPMVQAAEKTKKAGKDIQTEADKVAARIRDYVAAEQKAFANDNASPELIKFRERLAVASDALKAGLQREADVLIDIATSASVATDELQQVAKTNGEILKTVPQVEILRDKWGEFRAEIEDAERRFLDVGFAADDVFYSIRNKDWLGAFSSLLRVIDQIQVEFAKAGNLAGKIGAVAGAANAVGGAIGGKAGGALSGAASGAALGAKLGSFVPGIGTIGGAVLGGVLGGIGGLFGASKAKKRAKKEAAARAKAEAEQKAADLAAAKRELELRIMELQGKESEALAERRKDELAKMDESLRALQEQAWALEDQAAAQAKLTAAQEAAAAQLKDLQQLYLEVLDPAAAAEAARAEVLAGLPENLRELQRAIWGVQDAQEAVTAAEAARDEAVAAAEGRIADARAALTDAYDREAHALKATRDRFADLADTLADFGKELEGLVSLDPAASLAARRAEFERVSALAAGGNEQALADLPAVSRQFIEASRASAPDARAYARDLAAVRRATAEAEKAARGQVSAAEQQLLALQASVQWLIAINQTELTVKQALDGLAEAIAQSAAEQRAALDAVARATRAAADAAAAAKAANDNAVKVPGFDATAAAAALTTTATTAAVEAVVASDGASPLAGAIEAALGPYLLPIVKATTLTADLTQIARDEAEAA